MAPSKLSPTPILSNEKHTGIPERYASEADTMKARIYSNRTIGDASKPRTTELLALPPDVDRATFNKAIAELKYKLGDENVEVNDKPLIDGWYMEQP
jgi:hypothetical protein